MCTHPPHFFHYHPAGLADGHRICLRSGGIGLRRGGIPLNRFMCQHAPETLRARTFGDGCDCDKQDGDYLENLRKAGHANLLWVHFGVLLRTCLLFQLALPQQKMLASILRIWCIRHQFQITAHVPHSIFIVL